MLVGLAKLALPFNEFHFEDVQTLPAVSDYDERLPSAFYLMLPNDFSPEAFIESF